MVKLALLIVYVLFFSYAVIKGLDGSFCETEKKQKK
jgi:hypothetical protein